MDYNLKIIIVWLSSRDKIAARLSQTTIPDHFTPLTQSHSSSVFRRILYTGKTRPPVHVYARGSRTKPISLDITPVSTTFAMISPYIPHIPTSMALTRQSNSTSATHDMARMPQPLLSVHSRQQIPRYTPLIQTSLQMIHSSPAGKTHNMRHSQRSVMLHTSNAPTIPHTVAAAQNYSPPLYFYDAQSNNGFQSPPSTLRQVPSDGQLDGD